MNGKKIHIVIEYLYYGGLLGLFYLSVYLVKNKAKSAWFTLLATVALYGGPAIVSTAVVIGVLKLLISIGEDGGNTKSVKIEKLSEQDKLDRFVELSYLQMTITKIKSRYKNDSNPPQYLTDSERESDLRGCVGYADFAKLDSLNYAAYLDDSLDARHIRDIKDDLEHDYPLY